MYSGSYRFERQTGHRIAWSYFSSSPLLEWKYFKIVRAATSFQTATYSKLTVNFTFHCTLYNLCSWNTVVKLSKNRSILLLLDRTTAQLTCSYWCCFCELQYPHIGCRDYRRELCQSDAYGQQTKPQPEYCKPLWAFAAQLLSRILFRSTILRSD